MVLRKEVKRKTDDSIQTQRLEAFSDAVFGVIITIMVLEFHLPEGDTLQAIIPLVPIFLVYILSFVFIGIYANNHHLLFRAANRISGGVMWANLHLLFWLSLVPFATAWVGKYHQNEWPAVMYGAIGFFAALAYYILVRLLIKENKGAVIQKVLAKDTKGKVSAFLYVVGIGFAFINPLFSYLTYAIVSIMWLIPDRRLRNI
jgi:uncharacterized membrane protein